MTRLAPLLLTAFIASCGTTTVPGADIVLSPLEVQLWVDRDVLMPGTPMTVSGSGFLPPELGTQVGRLLVNGNILDTPLTFVDEKTLTWAVGSDLLAAVPPGSGVVTGGFTVTRTLSENGSRTATSIPVQFRVETNLTPTIAAFESEDQVLFPGDEITVRGADFLLKGEGHTVMVLEGSFVTLVPPETVSVQAVLPVTGDTRDTIRFTLTPDVLGIRPGTFQGALTVSNETPDGTRPGTGLPDFTRTVEAPKVVGVSPSVAARGQRISVAGRGFLQTDPFYEATTLIRLEGEFTIAKTSAVLTLAGPTALALFPDAIVSNREMEYILRVTQTPSGELEGLGLLAGGFVGSIIPMLISGPEMILGQGVNFTLQVAPQRQIVFIKFLPGFSTTMLEMGMGVVETQVRSRVLEVVNRDYAGVNIEFRGSRPDDFVEYSIIEVGGADPNQAGLFGLDNTKGKDVGNLRFNDVIGGTNAETAEQGYYAFGGVFVRSFFQLSPSGLGGTTPQYLGIRALP